MELTQDRLRKLLRYNPRTGEFTWLVDGYNKCVRAGDKAGNVNPHDGRIRIRIAGRAYLASRLAFFYMTGRWPYPVVDHKNRNMSDNRWRNLREATHSQNLFNMTVRNNRTGFKGVVFHKKKYVAQISINNRPTYLGSFDTPEEAHAAYLKRAKELAGEFARAK